MPFNGAGTFNRLYSWVTDAANNVFVDATRMDADTNGIATGLSNCMTRDGQSPPTADIPMGSHKITGLANGTASTDATAFGQLTLPAVTVPTLLGTWAAVVSDPVSYYKDVFGIVHLQGSIISGTNQTSAFTLPVGYRPTTGLTRLFPSIDVSVTPANSKLGWVYIDESTGSVIPTSSGPVLNTGFSLNGISFRTT